ncbi:Callose synthase [Arachis hypogaea]|nr:Callose synthase [Arachis hypogaea]
MGKELDAILDHGEAYLASSCTATDGSVKFLEQIICPRYEIQAAVSCIICRSCYILLCCNVVL